MTPATNSPSRMKRRWFSSEAWVAARPALRAYWLFSLGGMVALSIAILGYERHFVRDLGILATMAAGAGTGTLLGNWLAIRRLRVFWMALFAVAFFFVVTLLAAHGLRADLVLAFLYTFLFGTVCGHLAIQHRFELVASFVPIVGWGGSIMVILNRMHRVEVWEQSKVSSWLPVPLLFLALGSVGFVAFLAGNQRHRLDVWRGLGGTITREEADGAPPPVRRLRPIVALGLFTFLATALISPYLWRTGRGDRPSDDPGRPTGDKEHKIKLDGDEIIERLKELAERVKENAERTLPFLVPFFLAQRPLRRLFLISHWRSPFWRTSPTDRVEGLWRLVRLACADAGLRMHESDTLEDLVERAAPLLPPERAAELRAVAARYRRVRYGLGLLPDDAEQMGHGVDRAYAGLRAPLSRWQRVRSWFRRIED